MRTHSTPYCFASTFILATLGQSCHSPNHAPPDDPNIRREVLRIIQDHYFESVNPDTLLPTKKFVKNLDPFSFYMSRSEYEKDELHFNDQDFRYGVSILASGRHLILAQVLPQSAAEHAGLLAGDELVAISHRALNGSDSLAAAILTKSTSAEFDILRGNSKTIRRLTVQKGVCEQSSVPIATMFDSAIAYIQVTGFNHGTAAKIIEAMHSLSLQGMREAIIDLRFNSGGFVTETLSALNIFVHSDKPVPHETLRDTNYRNECTLPEEAIYPILPLAVLVGNHTCSAAELFSGVLQDLDRATIVGQPTLGKSLGMNFFTLSNGDRLYLAVGEFSLPSGRTIQRPYLNGKLIGGEERDFGTFENTAHTIDTDLAEADCPNYFTRGGRTVTGSSGIIPDYFVSAQSYGPEWLLKAERGAAASYIHTNAQSNFRETLDNFVQVAMPESLVESVLSQVRAHDTTARKLLSARLSWGIPRIIKAMVAYDIWEERGAFAVWEGRSAAVRLAAALLWKSAQLPLADRQGVLRERKVEFQTPPSQSLPLRANTPQSSQ